MSEQLILTELYGAVVANAAVPCVIVRFQGFANRDEFKRIMNSGLAYYQAPCRPAQPWGWVGDTRQMGAIPKEVQQWLTSDWNVRAYAAGIREISIIVSENIFGQLATQQYVQQTVARQENYEIEPKYYDSPAAASAGAARRCALLRAGSAA